MNSKLDAIYRPEIHRFLYVLLLIVTPFLLLQNYLQSLIGQISRLTFDAFGYSIPVTVTVAVVLIAIILFFTVKKLNKGRIISWFIVVILFWIGQNSTDFYFDHKYYDLQYNWHYFAYAIFAYLNYLVLSGKNVPSQKIILYTFISAIAISTFDELMQVPLSNRIFDLGDIAKDLWGSMIGLFIIYFIIENGKIINKGLKIRHKKIRDYFNSPISMLVFEFLFAYIFMVVASLLTLTTYIFTAVFISVILFAIIFIIIHLSQFKVYKTLIIVIFSAIIITQVFLFVKYFNKGITYNNNKILVYKGIPIFFFDVLIYPNGMFRLVDKKKAFNQRDQKTISNLSEYIAIIGSGTDGSGGQGFPRGNKTQFIYNLDTNQGLQVIILKNDKACIKFNSLSKANKRPLFILHNN